jgi:peptidoglycan L-alanyl-D-glutamate endopeptidase CwlK
MGSFSSASIQKLKTCHKDLQVLFNEVGIAYDCTVVSGHRNKEDQEKAFAEGRSKLKYPQSKHNILPSMAVDVSPWEPGGIDWGKLQSAHFAGYVLGVANMLFKNGKMQHRIRCGIDWDSDNDIDDTKFWDAGHFELVFNPKG